jgi:hypothetical protein
MTQPLKRHSARLSAAAELLAILQRQLPVAWQLLGECQPGYPSGGDGGPSSLGDHSDRTGNLATTSHNDVARRDLDDLDRLLVRITEDVVATADIVRRWQPPTRKWREALATEAAASYRDTDCRSCLRVGVLTPRRHEGGSLCRRCQDYAREVGADMPPVWLVDKAATGRRITTADLDRAKAETKQRRKRRR